MNSFLFLFFLSRSSSLNQTDYYNHHFIFIVVTSLTCCDDWAYLLNFSLDHEIFLPAGTFKYRITPTKCVHFNINQEKNTAYSYHPIKVSYSNHFLMSVKTSAFLKFKLKSLVFRKIKLKMLKLLYFATTRDAKI